MRSSCRRAVLRGPGGLAHAALLVLVLVATGCRLRGRARQPAADEFATLVAQGVALTLTAAVPGLATETPAGASPTAGVPSTTTPTPISGTGGATATPSAPALLPTPATPRSEFFADARYELADELVVGAYAVRTWRNANATGQSELGVDRILTIEAAGMPPVQIEFFAGLDPLTGTDITGDGTPEVIVETYTGGAHCCFGTAVFSLGEQLESILSRAASNCGGDFRDLDGDGVLEFLTCDDLMAYTYCPYAGSPIVTVILAYEPSREYLPASSRFPAEYAEAIAAHTRQAEQGRPGELGEWDATTKCSILPLVLDYLYSGQAEKAWSEFNRLYTYPDADTFRAEIEQAVSQSPLFAPLPSAP